MESEEIIDAGWLGWRVGKLAATVNDAAGEPVQNASVVVFEKSASGTLRAVLNATTNQNGQVYLDPAGLGSGATYVLKVVDPLGSGESYFSSLVNRRGAVSIGVVPGETNAPDLAPPQLAIDHAYNGARLGDHGFTVTGSFSDNDRVRTVTVRVRGAEGVIAEMPATLRHGTGRWEAAIPAVTAAVPALFSLEVEALDRAHNRAETSAAIVIVRDAAGPVVQVTSHSNQDVVPDGAFVVSGTAFDLVGSTTLRARLLNDAGVAFDERAVEIAESNGRWSYTAFAGEALPSAQIVLEFLATDDAGNETREVLHLTPSPEARLIRRALGRLTFGATPELEEEVAAMGLAAFIEQQLNSQTIDDSDFVEQRSLPDRAPQRMLEAMLYSRRQLREVLAVFWANHFNTDLSQHNVHDYELSEHEAFRLHALGRFRDLLGASAKSPAMLRYLDGHSNVAAHPNENYARELLEL
ncbi:MAG: DUF1800 family protein, partial [Gammaproteobacteria bacterium]